MLWMLTVAHARLLSTDAGGYVAQHNKKRCARGIAPVSWSPKVAASAQSWASRCVYQHDTSSGYAENMMQTTKRPSAAHAVQAWYQSPGHFRNLMKPSVTEIGCGTCKSGSRYMVWCQYGLTRRPRRRCGASAVQRVSRLPSSLLRRPVLSMRLWRRAQRQFRLRNRARIVRRRRGPVRVLVRRRMRYLPVARRYWA